MPKVPVVSGPRVAQSGGPGAQFTAPQIAAPDARLATPTLNTSLVSTPQFQARAMRPFSPDPSSIRSVQLSDGGARQALQTSQNLGAASQSMERAVLEMQAKANAVTVDDALNRLRTQAMHITYGDKDAQTGNVVGGYSNLKGEQAFRRPDGKGLDDEVGDQFDTARKDIAGQLLTNADQRRVFEMQANDIGAQLRQGALVHQDSQFNDYTQNVYKSTLVNQTAAFALVDAGDRDGQRRALEEIDRTVGTLAVHNGASQAEYEMGLRTARTAAVETLFSKTLAEKKYLTATGVLNEYSTQIDPNSAAKMRAMLDGHVTKQVGLQLGQKVWGTEAAPALNAGTSDRAYNVNINLESNGRQVDADGKLLASYNGTSFGAGQLNPDTATRIAKAHGQPQLAKTAMEATEAGKKANLQIARWHWDDLVGKFGGDTIKASAAYNAGEGYLTGGKAPDGHKLEGALKWSARTGQDWRQYPEFKPETRDRIAKVEKAVGRGEGQPARPSKSQMYAAIEAQSDDPDAVETAKAYVDKQFAAADYDKAKGDEDSYAAGVTAVREANGDINAISPELKARIRPDQYTSLQTYAKNITDGSYNSTDNAYYYVGMGMSQDPKTTASQIEALRPHLAENDFRVIQKAWVDKQAPDPGKGPDSLDVTTLDNIVDTRLQYLGINIKPGKNDTEAIARLGAIRQFTHQYVLDLQRQSRQKFTDYKQLEDTVNLMFTRDHKWKQLTLGGVQHGSTPVLTSGVRDIPTDTRKRVTEQLQKHLGRKPSDAEILQGYFRSRFYGG